MSERGAETGVREPALVDYPVGGITRLVAVAMIVAPLAFAPLLLGDREVRVVCERTGPGTRDGTCVVERARLFRTERQEVPLGFVLRARLDQAGGERVMVSLVTPEGAIPITEAGAGDRGESLVRPINAFLADPTQKTLRAADARGGGLYAFYAALACALAAFGAFVYRSAPGVRVELDREMDAVRVVRHVFPLRPAAQSVARGDVADAVVEGVPEEAPDRWRVTLVKKNGERLPLTAAHHGGDRAPHDDVAAKIRAFVTDGRERRETPPAS